MTNKQENFKNIFIDSNISEIIWYYKFNENNYYIVSDSELDYKSFKLSFKSGIFYKYYYTIRNYKVLKNTQYLFYKDFYHLIKELYDASKTDSSSLINFKKYINNNILNNKNIEEHLYDTTQEPLWRPFTTADLHTSHFIKHKDYKSIKIKNCGKIIAQYLTNIIKNKFDTEMLKNYDSYYDFWELVYNLGNARSRKQFEKYISIFFII
jgi:hypothetical protein